MLLNEKATQPSGENARLPPMCPGFDSRTWRHMWVEFLVGSLLCSERFFSGYSDFPLSSGGTPEGCFDIGLSANISVTF